MKLKYLIGGLLIVISLASCRDAAPEPVAVVESEEAFEYVAEQFDDDRCSVEH